MSQAPPQTYKRIHLANAFLTRTALERYVEAQDRYAPYTDGVASVTFARDAAGLLPIAGLTGIAMSESTAAPGTYTAVMPSGAVSAALTALLNTLVYQIVTAGTLADLRIVTTLLVSTPRFAQ